MRWVVVREERSRWRFYCVEKQTKEEQIVRYSMMSTYITPIARRHPRDAELKRAARRIRLRANLRRVRELRRWFPVGILNVILRAL
jgi:hypothetical protein